MNIFIKSERLDFRAGFCPNPFFFVACFVCRGPYAKKEKTRPISGRLEQAGSVIDCMDGIIKKKATYRRRTVLFDSSAPLVVAVLFN